MDRLLWSWTGRLPTGSLHSEEASVPRHPYRLIPVRKQIRESARKWAQLSEGGPFPSLPPGASRQGSVGQVGCAAPHGVTGAHTVCQPHSPCWQSDSPQVLASVLRTDIFSRPCASALLGIFSVVNRRMISPQIRCLVDFQ